jgi:two-component system, NtrC family, nitrogen regulation response regulator GlnG
MEATKDLKRRKRIVLATSDRGIEDSLRKRFSELKYELFTVTRGLEAVTEMLDHDVDLMIVDLDMTGNVGVDVLPVIRRLRPRMPVVMLADDITFQIRKIAAEQGVTFQTTRPRDHHETIEIVEATEKIIAKRELLTVN